MTSSVLVDHLRPGDNVLVGQAVAEPPELTRQLVAAAQVVPELTAYCGYSMGTAWDEIGDGTLTVRGFIAHGGMRRLARRGLLDVIPWHLSSLETNIERGLLRVDVVLLQVGPPDTDGYYNLGATADYATAAASRARVVLVEVNENMPRTTSSRRLHVSQVTTEIRTSVPLVEAPRSRPVNEAEHEVARRVAALVPDGGCLQIGLGPLADAVVGNLGDRSGLRVRAGVAGDWLVDLYESGVMAPGRATAHVSMALGSRRLYDFLDGNDAVRFASTGDLVAPEAIATEGPLVAVNSAIEVDLLGQVNAEVAAGRYVGGIGGQVDFLRAAARSPSGVAVIALASIDPAGASRIVSTLSGPVTTPCSDVGLVITEHGAADLRAASVKERAALMVAVADPVHRAALRARIDDIPSAPRGARQGVMN